MLTEAHQFVSAEEGYLAIPSGAFIYKGDNFCDFLMACLHIKTLLKRGLLLTLLLLNTTCPVLANSVDPGQQKPTDLDLHCLSLNM